MKNIKIISFDLDGTLFEGIFDEFVWDHEIPRMYAEKHGLSFERASRIVQKEYKKLKNDLGLKWYDIDFWLNHLKLEKSREEVFEESKHKIKVFSDVPPVLEQLSKKYKLIITAVSRKEFLSYKLKVKSLEKYFYRTFSVLSDFKKKEKTTGIYRKICGTIDVKPEEMVHVGDEWNQDYLVPKRLGIKAIFLDRTGKKKGENVIKSLEELLTIFH